METEQIVSSQLLTVKGQVLRPGQGRVVATILNDSQQSLVSAGTDLASDGSYRLTLINLSDLTSFQAGDQLQLEFFLLGQPDDRLEVVSRELQTEDILSQLVEQDITLLPEISLVDAIDFGDVSPDVNAQQSLVISNSGYNNLVISRIEAFENEDLLQTAVELTSGVQLPLLIEAQSQQTIQLDLLAAADYSGTSVLVLTSNSKSGGEEDSSTRTSIEIRASLLLPQIRVEPTVDLGAVYIGLENRFQLEIHNDGRLDLEISQIRLSADSGLELISDLSSIGPGGSRKLDLRLEPNQLGSYSSSLLIDSNDPESLETAVSLQATVMETEQIVSSQLLTVKGRVFELIQGQVSARILNPAGDVLHQSSSRIIEGEYSLTLIDLSDLTPFNTSNLVEITVSDDIGILNQLPARPITYTEINTNLIIQDFPKSQMIELNKEQINFGTIFSGMNLKRSLEINNLSNRNSLEIFSIYTLVNSGVIDFPYLSINPQLSSETSLQIEPNQNQIIDLELDLSNVDIPTDLTDLEVELVIESNDPLTPIQKVPFQLSASNLPDATDSSLLAVSGQVIGTSNFTNLEVYIEVYDTEKDVVRSSARNMVGNDGKYQLILFDPSDAEKPVVEIDDQLIIRLEKQILGDQSQPRIISQDIQIISTEILENAQVFINIQGNRPPVIKAEAETSILILSDQYSINLSDYIVDPDLGDSLIFQVKRIGNPSLLALYDQVDNDIVLAEEDQVTTGQLGIFMTDIGQTDFEVTATDTAREQVSITIQVQREQLITVVDEIDFGSVLPGMSIERQLLIQNTASVAELSIVGISSNLGPSLSTSQQPSLLNPLSISAGQAVELILTLRTNDNTTEIEDPRLIILSNQPDDRPTVVPINLVVSQLSLPTETNLMVVKGFVEKRAPQVYEDLSVGIWIERVVEIDIDDDGLEDRWEQYHFNSDLTITDGSEDSDNDGQDNWSEFHGRSNPNDLSSLPHYFENVPVNNDGSYRILLANLATGNSSVLPVVAEGDTLFVYLDDEADRGSDEEFHQVTTTDISKKSIQIDLEAVMTISKSISIRGFDDPVVLTITDQVVGLGQPPRIQQVRATERERVITTLQVGIEQDQPERQIETILKIEVPGTSNTGVGGIFQDTPLGIEIPFDTTKTQPVDVIALISVDSVSNFETVEILATEVIDGNKLKAQLAHLSYVVTMKNTAPVLNHTEAYQSLEVMGAVEDDQTGNMILAITAGDDNQIISLNGIFSDADSGLGDKMTYSIVSHDSELVDVFAEIDGDVAQLVLDITDEKSQEGIAEIDVLVEDTNGLSTETLTFFVEVSSVTPNHWRAEINLLSGLNLVSLPLQPMNQERELQKWTAADMAEKTSATLIVSMDDGEFVPFIPQVMQDAEGNYVDQGFNIEGGKGYIINVLNDRPIILNGQPWEQSPNYSEGLGTFSDTEPEMSDRLVSRAPNRVFTPWTFVISGNLMTDSALSFGFDLSQVNRVLAVNSQTGKELTGKIQGHRFHFVMTDLALQPVVSQGQTFDIRAEDIDGNLIAGPISWQLDSDHLRQAYIHRELTIGDIIPSQTQLLPNYPNPFNPETWIPFELEQASNVQLTIFDSQGNTIRQINLGYQIAGRYLSKNRAAHWDGNNQLGEQVSSGVYFYTFIAKSEQSKWLHQTRKMVILK